MNNLEKLNRLRVNAGKSELKAWKASSLALEGAIQQLEKAGFTDALPGANLKATPTTDDPAVAKVLPTPPEASEVLKNAKEAVKKKVKEMKEKSAPEPEKPSTKIKPQLARGLETESFARQSRIAVQMQRKKEKVEEKEEKDIKKAEAKELKKGQVDPKKDPDKAKRQEKHIKEKKEAREKSGKAPKPEKDSNDITVAEIARELGLDPKVARAKLRRHEEKLTKLHTKGQDRWTFPKSAKAEISSILK